MDVQVVLNLCFSVIGAFSGFWMKTMWQSIKDVQRNEQEVAKRISSIEVLVAGQYVKRDDFHNFSEGIFKKLDRIEDKLDSKADKT